jgi:hypothetical protein
LSLGVSETLYSQVLLEGKSRNSSGCGSKESRRMISNKLNIRLRLLTSHVPNKHFTISLFHPKFVRAGWLFPTSHGSKNSPRNHGLMPSLLLWENDFLWRFPNSPKM